IEVRVSASGYLQAGYWDPDQRNYGARIWETTMGSLHDHVINYKVDLDIVGTANSLLKTTTKQEVVTHPWFNDDWGNEVIQQTIHREYITNEDDALLKLPDNLQGGYSIVNQEEKNKWGTVRGYAIHPGYSPIHGTVVGSKRLLHNANWARYNLAVSRRKETEPSSSSVWNFNLPGAPPVDFHKFFDGENITQEDLVAWVNVGMHHLPQSEDAPNTRTNTATSR
ncbi:amine oxidase catalytic domain-containing protein, partial [Imleria badia]